MLHESKTVCFSYKFGQVGQVAKYLEADYVAYHATMIKTHGSESCGQEKQALTTRSILKARQFQILQHKNSPFNIFYIIFIQQLWAHHDLFNHHKKYIRIKPRKSSTAKIKILVYSLQIFYFLFLFSFSQQQRVCICKNYLSLFDLLNNH